MLQFRYDVRRHTLCLACGLALAMGLGCGKAPPAPGGGSASHAESADEDEIDFQAFSTQELVAHARAVGLAITVLEDCSLSLYPSDRHQKLGAAIITRADEVARLVDPDAWMNRAILGTWKCVKKEETSIGTFRKGGELEVRREHKSLVLGALTSAIHGRTILYRWTIHDGKLHTAVHGSETGNIDRLTFLVSSDSTAITFVSKDHVQVYGSNAIGNVDWHRIGH